MANSLLEISNLVSTVQDDDQAQPVQILNSLDLVVQPGEVHAIMGPNGSGKSTLANTLMGSPQYEVAGGSIKFKDTDISDLDPDERSKLGMFMAFQYPQTIPGVSVLNFLRQALSARKGIEMSVLELRLSIMEWIDKLGIDESFLERHLNDGFSGGEKKRNEVLQMAVLEPDLAILDETDSGLDIDALAAVADGVNQIKAQNPDMGVVAITHYIRLLNYLKPSHVHILANGRIIKSGGFEIAERLEAEGYESFL